MILTAHEIDTKPLSEICTTLAILIQKNKYGIDGSLLARLAKRLITAEVQPGGPYRNERGEVELETNLAIGYLFLCLKKPLPAVTRFIESTSETDKRSVALYEHYHALQEQSATPSPEAELIYEKAKITLGKLETPVQDLAIKFLNRVKSADKHHEIALLSSRFHQSLQKPRHPQYLQTLGEANVYCWIAYTIYDHLIDGETTTEFLPVANIAMRLSIERYTSIFPADHRFVKIIQKTFTAMDNANAWELAHCRFKATDSHLSVGALPIYGRRFILARRSFGHALGPFALASLSGATLSQLTNIEKGLSHYLITRQLNDDMHDWRKDLRDGHISPVVALLLRQANISPGTYSFETLTKLLTPLFWEKTIDTMNMTIHSHALTSIKHFHQSQLLQKNADFLTLITRLDDMAHNAPKAHEQYQSLLANIKHMLK